MSDRFQLESNMIRPGLAEDKGRHSEHKLFVALFLFCTLTVTVGWWVGLAWAAVWLARQIIS